MDNKLLTDLQKNTINLRTLMDNTSDLTIKFAKCAGVNICIIFCEGMINTNVVANLVYRPLNDLPEEPVLEADVLMKKIQSELLLAGEQRTVTDYDALATAIMSGFIAILIEGVPSASLIGVQGFAARSISEPSTHSNLRSARDSFIEVVRTNVSMVRRRMKSPSLVMKMLTLGDRSNTDVCVCYLKDKIDQKLLKGVLRTLKNVDINTVIDGSCLGAFLSEGNSLVFNEIGITERPDKFVSKLYEGRIGIIVDGTPFAIFLPHLFIENFQTVDDYTGGPVFATFIRALRYFAYIFSILLPGFYVALANFNPELFPDSLLLNLIYSIERTPYALLPELLLIHIFYEIMREAGLRLPKNVGHVVSIVGGLVIGQIVVSAGLVGAPLVLIVAITAISAFVVPDLYESSVIARFAFIIAGGIWGILGLCVVGVIFLLKISSIKSFGAPYLAPLAPFSFKAMRDVVLRVSWKKLVKGDVKIQDLNGVDTENE